MRKLLPALAAAAALVPTVAIAHTGVSAAHDLSHGFVHPLLGLDHVLAMVAVGVLAAQLGGRALWLVPAAFVAVMALAGALGMAGIGVPHVELGIAMSVIVLGVMIALDLAMPVAAAMALVGFFAIFHGHVHGAEMPATMSGVAYGAGFVAATALLHALGVGAGVLIGRPGDIYGRYAVRMIGSVAAVVGVGLLAL